ncbi:MAG: response regulator [Candidatus Hodarchaeales archaeon]
MHCRKISILHVDDEEDYLDLAKSFLEDVNDNLDVFAVSSPLDVLDIMGSENNIDIIVSDLYMPYMTGLELRELLKKKGITTPFILLSGSNRKLTELNFCKNIDVPYFLKNDPNPEKLFLQLSNRISQMARKNNLPVIKSPYGSSQTS